MALRVAPEAQGAPEPSGALLLPHAIGDGDEAEAAQVRRSVSNNELNSARQEPRDRGGPRAYSEPADCEAFSKGDVSLYEAVMECNPLLVRKIIAAGASVNVPIYYDDSDGDCFVTLLHVMSSRPDLELSQDVISEITCGKADLNARSLHGSTPLARACLHKHTTAAKVLVKLGADPRPVDDKGRNALHCAVSLDVLGKAEAAGDQEARSAHLVALLAECGADMDDGGEVAPLLRAIQAGNRLGAEALLHHGATPRFLQAAVDSAPASIVQLLIKAEADPFEEEQKKGGTVLDAAFCRGDEEITTLVRDFMGLIERRKSQGQLTLRPSQISAQAKLEQRPIWASRREDEDLVQKAEEPEEIECTLGLSSEFYDNPKNRTDCVITKKITEGGYTTFQAGLASPPTLDAKGRPVEPQKTSEQRKNCKLRFAKLQKDCRRVNRDRNFVRVMLTALILALFCPDLWVLADIGSNDGLDAILICVFLAFIVEFLVQAIGLPKMYINSFFMWTDILALLSVPLDHSLVANNLPYSMDNGVLMRLARTARLGARAGRFTKLVKLLRFLPGVYQDAGNPSQGTAKTMSKRLMTSLSTRVSVLIILMVMALPLFEFVTYPENDFSMKAWLNSLDFSLEHYGAEVFRSRVDAFEAFYGDKDYFPFEIVWEDRNGSISRLSLKGERPTREANEMEAKADSGDVLALFNFGAKARVDALCNIILLVVIIILMMGFSMLLSNSVSEIVLQPLENLLAGVTQMASKICKSVTTMTAKCITGNGEFATLEEEDGDEGAFVTETELLEKVIDKLANLSALTTKTALNAETLAQLGESGAAAGALETIDSEPRLLKGTGAERDDKASPRGGRASSHDSSSPASRAEPPPKGEDFTEQLMQTLEAHLEEAGISWSSVDSWDFNVLDLQENRWQPVCMLFLTFHLSQKSYSLKQQQCFSAFIDTASKGYSDSKRVPYHNWYHAMDVTHCLFRMLNTCNAEVLMSNIERFALITSALCHDIGHPGVNNIFMVETAHEMAIRYNDHSPLENMHCAKLFEIVSQPKTAVFHTLDKQQYREVRSICVEAILHTDNIHHFAMVKELQVLYEMNSDILDVSWHLFSQGQLEALPKEVCDILTTPDQKKLIRNLFLHFSDISNPMKPLAICKRWAYLIIDEFFMQGDMEKQLGITVQPLNDRDKVNKPYSQVGFIEFFVAPFAFATVRLLPQLVVCSDEMMVNLNAWLKEWFATADPPPDAEDVAKLQDRMTKLEAKYIFRDGF